MGSIDVPMTTIDDEQQAPQELRHKHQAEPLRPQLHVLPIEFTKVGSKPAARQHRIPT